MIRVNLLTKSLISLLITTAFLSSVGRARELNCRSLFIEATPTAISEETQNVLSYLSYLFAESGAFSRDDLVALQNHLRGGYRGVPPTMSQKSTLNGNGHIFSQQLNEILRSPAVELKTIDQWIDHYLAQQSELEGERNLITEETTSTGQELEFSRIPQGSYVDKVYSIALGPLGTWHKKTKIHLKQDFLVSTTPITQRQWVEVMGYNPSAHKGGPSSTEIDVNGTRIRLQPDHPVENVTWWSVLVFLNKLSELHGLPPVYDLNDMEFFNFLGNQSLSKLTSKYSQNPELAFEKAAHGLLFLTTDFSIFKINKYAGIRINSPTGSIYDAEGFRLLTSYEHDYLRSNLDRTVLNSNVDPISPEFLEHAWVSENASNSTQPVALLRGLVIAGDLPIYDLFGNVYEICQNGHRSYYFNRSNPEGNRNVDLRNLWANRPYGRLGGITSICGGSYQSHGPISFERITLGYQRPQIGFRIARTIKTRK